MRMLQACIDRGVQAVAAEQEQLKEQVFQAVASLTKTEPVTRKPGVLLKQVMLAVKRRPGRGWGWIIAE